MKALIRNEGETITEDMDVPCIDWNSGAPLTNEKWFGGPYTLVANYVPPMDENIVQPKQEEMEEEIVEDDDYVDIDGKRYSKKELRSLLE